MSIRGLFFLLNILINLFKRNAVTGELIHTITGHSGVIKGMDYSVDGNKIISASEDTRIKVWRSDDFSLV